MSGKLRRSCLYEWETSLLTLIWEWNFVAHTFMSGKLRRSHLYEWETLSLALIWVGNFVAHTYMSGKLRRSHLYEWETSSLTLTWVGNFVARTYMSGKLRRSHWGRNEEYGLSRIGCWGGYLGLRDEVTGECWRVLYCVLFTKYYSGDQIKSNDTGRACNT
jgi:hypothetical protein